MIKRIEEIDMIEAKLTELDARADFGDFVVNDEVEKWCENFKICKSNFPSTQLRIWKIKKKIVITVCKY